MCEARDACASTHTYHHTCASTHPHHHTSGTHTLHPAPCTLGVHQMNANLVCSVLVAHAVVVRQRCDAPAAPVPCHVAAAEQQAAQRLDEQRALPDPAAHLIGAAVVARCQQVQLASCLRTVGQVVGHHPLRQQVDNAVDFHRISTCHLRHRRHRPQPLPESVGRADFCSSLLLKKS